MRKPRKTKFCSATLSAPAGVIVKVLALLKHEPGGPSFGDLHSPSFLDPLGLSIGIGAHRPGLFIASMDPAVPVTTVVQRLPLETKRCSMLS
jgi:hypothetical protein